MDDRLRRFTIHAIGGSVMKRSLNSLYRSCRRGAGFAVLQGAIVATAAGFGWHQVRTESSRGLIPALNAAPRQVAPLYDYPFVVTDDQLAKVLEKLHPKFTAQPTKINFIDHAIRMWDDDAQFSDGAIDGRQMLALLLNHQEFSKNWNPDIPLLQRSEHGVTVNTQQGRPSVSHVDHLMGTLAEIGISLDQPIMTANGPAEVRQILENALHRFATNQREYEWTTLAAAFYVQDASPWFSVEGELIDFNHLAKRIMRQQQPQGVCYGQHRLYTLTMLLRIDDQLRQQALDNASQPMQGLVTVETRAEVLDYLMGMTKRLYHTQAVAGYWDGNWPDTDQAIPDPGTDPLSRRILATGHVLEWWAMAPKELHPPRDTIVRASQWLANEIIVMDPQQIEKNYTFLTHAGRALALWRNTLPAEFERRHNGHGAIESVAVSRTNL